MAYYGAYELVGKLSSLENRIEEKRDDIVLNYIKKNYYALKSLDELIMFIAEIKAIDLVKRDPTLINSIMDNEISLNHYTYTIIGENVYRSLFGSLNTTDRDQKQYSPFNINSKNNNILPNIIKLTDIKNSGEYNFNLNLKGNIDIDKVYFINVKNKSNNFNINDTLTPVGDDGVYRVSTDIFSVPMKDTPKDTVSNNFDAEDIAKRGEIDENIKKILGEDQE